MALSVLLISGRGSPMEIADNVTTAVCMGCVFAIYMNIFRLPYSAVMNDFFVNSLR